MDPMSTIGAIPTLLDLLNKVFKGKESPDALALKQGIFSLQQVVLTLQARLNEVESAKIGQERENLKLKEEITKLTQQISDKELWQKEWEQYEVVKLRTGSIVYKLKGKEDFFCPLCLVEKHMAVHLQPSINLSSDNYHCCPKCKQEFYMKDFNETRPRHIVRDTDEGSYY